MKKLVALLLVLILALSLASCSKPGSGAGTDPSQGSQPQTPSGSGGAPAVLVNDSVNSYSQAYKNYETLYSAMNDAYYAVLDPHNEAIEQSSDDYWDDPNHFSDVVDNFVNISIGLTATFGDSGYQTGVAAMFEMFNMKDAKVEELDGKSYKMTYVGVYNDPVTWESYENVPWEELCGFDPATGSLYFRSYATVNGEKTLGSFVEFVPLGGGRYALQSESERGIVTMLNGEVAAYDYAAFKEKFDPEADAIFPNAAKADAAWITAGGGMYQHITLSDSSLHIWADEITDGLLSAPERDITIER